jgi:hypothetical protein
MNSKRISKNLKQNQGNYLKREINEINKTVQDVQEELNKDM